MMAIPGDHRSIEKASAAPWLPGWEPRAGRLARARLTRQADVAEIERFRPEICCRVRPSSIVWKPRRL